jgi:hypothetical protein
MTSVCDLRNAGRHTEALSTGLFCSRMHPADPHYHKALAYALMPKTIMQWKRNYSPPKPKSLAVRGAHS